MGKIQYVGATEKVYPVYKILPLAEHLTASGVSHQAALEGSGIPAAALNDHRALVSRSQIVAVFRNYLRLAPGHQCALELGARQRLTDFGFYGYALLSSATVRHAVHFGLAYREVATPIAAVELIEAAGQAAWLIEPFAEIAAGAALRQFIAEYQCGIMLALHRIVSGDGFRLTGAQFNYPAPAGADVYHAVLGCPIEFDAPVTELRFDAAWLEQRPLGANAVTFQLVEEACRDMLARIGSARGTIGEIYRRLLAQSGQFAKLEEMAGQLGLHPRTLRRKLADEGSNYQAIVDEVRFKLAATYLGQTAMTHEAISERLGFNDASSFRRAFKRWAKCSPHAFRHP